MNESIYANRTIETDLSRENDGYDHLLEKINNSFAEVANSTDPLFTTNLENLYDLFLENLPDEARQHYTCRTCYHFVNRYGGLVTVDDDGRIRPVMWRFECPEFFREAVEAVHKQVLSAKITGVFITSEKRLGMPKTGTWRHMAVTVPKDRILRRTWKTADQVAAEKKEEFRMLLNAATKYKKSTVETALLILNADALYRSEKFRGIAEWFLNVHNTIENKTGKNRTNLIWKFAATAPAGFCHISSSMIGTLLDDIEDGYGFETVKARFNEKMHPTRYQRPQARPSAGNVAQAEKIVEKLGIGNSLKRRFARLDEVQKFWEPRQESYTRKIDLIGGVFSGLKTKDSKTSVKNTDIVANGGIMTWDKFRRTVLPIATKIEYQVNIDKDGFGALVTAEDPAAPPIIVWDTDDNRNPFNWYCYNGGSYPSHWNLKPGYVEVTAIVLQPNLWQPGYEQYGSGLLFILKDCKDIRNKASALFPENLRSELREVRSTIEAYSGEHALSGVEEASACGILCQAGIHTWGARLRVTTNLGVTMYTLDRWD